MAHYRFPAGMGLTDAERSAVAVAIADVDAVLHATVDPQRAEVVEVAAEMLFSNFKASRKFRDEADQRADDQRVFDGFLIALAGRPTAAVTEAWRRLIRGEAPGMSKTFVPTSTEFADLVERIAGEWTWRRDRLEWLLRLKEAKPEPPAMKMTGPERAELDARIARLKRGRSVEPWGQGRGDPE